MPPDSNSWNEWKKYILKELKRVGSCYESLDKKIDTLMVEVAMLKVKAGVWGAIAGAIPAVMILTYFLLRKP